MATQAQIASDPRFAALPADRKQKILSMASDAPPSMGGGKPSFRQILSAGMSLTPWDKANQAFKRGIEDFSEYAGKNTNLDTTEIAAALTPLALAPEILGAVTGFRGAKASPNPTLRGLMNTPEELGPEYAAQNVAAGIKKAPIKTGPRAVFEDPYNYPSELSKPKYASVKSAQPEIVNAQGKVVSPRPPSSIQPTDAGPTSFTRPKPTLAAEPLPTTVPQKLPGKFSDLYEFIEGRINKFGDRITPQELQNYKSLVSKQMSDGTIPHFKPQELGGGTTEEFQQATNLLQKISGVFKKSMDSKLSGAELPEGVMRSRTALDKANTISNKLSRIPGKLYSGGKKAAIALGAIGGGTALYNALRK